MECSYTCKLDYFVQTWSFYELRSGFIVRGRTDRRTDEAFRNTAPCRGESSPSDMFRMIFSSCWGKSGKPSFMSANVTGTSWSTTWRRAEKCRRFQALSPTSVTFAVRLTLVSLVHCHWIILCATALFSIDFYTNLYAETRHVDLRSRVHVTRDGAMPRHYGAIEVSLLLLLLL